MLLAYIDEIGEPGAYVSKTHQRYNTSPAFGYAGFVIPERSARQFGQLFTRDKRTLFANELRDVEHPGRWERKGSDIFSANAWREHRNQIRVFRGLISELGQLNGRVFYYAAQKEIGTPKQVRLTHEALEASAMQETVNRLCRYAEIQDENVLLLVDQINEKQRAARVAKSYAHIFARSREFPEMKRAVEPPMHIDSALSSNIQFADWVAAAVGRAIDHQLEPESRYGWIPEALGSHMTQRITHESKLHLWHSSVKDLNHIDVFKDHRPYLKQGKNQSMSLEDIAKLKMVKRAAERGQKREKAPLA